MGSHCRAEGGRRRDSHGRHGQGYYVRRPFSIEASSFTTAKGKVIEFVTAKPKTITVAADSLIHERVNPASKQPFSEVKLGRRITIVGRDAGSGKPLAARLSCCGRKNLAISKRWRRCVSAPKCRA
jgi:hypothetical protein